QKLELDEKKLLIEKFQKEIRDSDDLNKIISLIKKYDIIKECYVKAQHYINLASNSLTVFQESKEKDIFKSLTSFSLARNF
ncbi:polyprenyl synthetase family protein, partial [Candidatus Pelagibacter sp.]|nr:polyprenyl synthetase family protein [Candidatus Pelagibacter sp.]